MPSLLDLFCGAGGAAMGYSRAGFDDITGVDIADQPRYPFRFVRGDALEYLAAHGAEYDAIHASPPCQYYTRLRYLPWMRGRVYWRSVPPTRHQQAVPVRRERYKVDVRPCAPSRRSPCTPL